MIAIEGLDLSEEEREAAIAAVVESSEEDPAEARAALEASGQVQVITGDILRRKALERLVESAKPVDGNGNPVDLTPALLDNAEDNDDTGVTVEAGSPQADHTDPDAEE